MRQKEILTVKETSKKYSLLRRQTMDNNQNIHAIMFVSLFVLAQSKESSMYVKMSLLALLLHEKFSLANYHITRTLLQRQNCAEMVENVLNNVYGMKGRNESVFTP
jgi:hypothetical protein